MTSKPHKSLESVPRPSAWLPGPCANRGCTYGAAAFAMSAHRFVSARGSRMTRNSKGVSPVVAEAAAISCVRFVSEPTLRPAPGLDLPR
jgi:hypothetical protein